MLIPALPQFSTACRAHITSGKKEDLPSRWSNTQLSTPAAIITPACEDDIILAIRYATEQGLKVIPAGGAHGSFVPINDRCIYLDMRNFNAIDLDEAAGSVTFGGGVITRDIVRSLSERGFYTCVPNSNAVGMVGFCLGGGSSPFNGLKGLAVDNILGIRIISATGLVRTLKPGTSGDEGELFNVLCGAGFGFGVITSVTLRAWHIQELLMDDDRIWSRKLIFPPSSIREAAQLFTELQHPTPKLVATLLFIRAPPSAPRPGAPMVMLNVNYFGPGAEAEDAAAAAFLDMFTSHAIVTETTYTTLSSMNDMAEPLNRHGDYKEQYAAWLPSISASIIESAFERWVRFGEKTPDAKATSYVVIAAKSTKGMLENDIEGKKAFPRVIRSRNVFVQVAPWWRSEESEPQARSWAEQMLALFNAPQQNGITGHAATGGGARVSAFAANLSKNIDLRTVWSPEGLEQIARLKKVWDPSDVFWNPVSNGV